MSDYGFLVGPALIVAGVLVAVGFAIHRRALADADRRAVQHNLAVSVARTNRGRHAGTRADYLGTFTGSDSDSDSDRRALRPVDGRSGQRSVRFLRPGSGVRRYVQRGLPDSRVA